MKTNIVLIGMPGAGKSTVGVLLAKTLLMDFVDTDLLIQKKYSRSLCELIEAYGSDSFINSENDTICSLECQNSVIATGGSAVYGSGAMKRLSVDGLIVYLKLPEDEIERRLSDIKTRGVVMKEGQTLSDLYAERSALYEQYAELTVDCYGLSPEQTVEKISDAVCKTH